MTARAFALTLGVGLGTLLACLSWLGFSAWRELESARGRIAELERERAQFLAVRGLGLQKDQ